MTKGLKSFNCIQLRIFKNPSRKVVNFRHLFGCDTKPVLHQYCRGATIRTPYTFRRSELRGVVGKVVDELNSRVCQNSMQNFREQKQWICRWQYLKFDGQLIQGRRVLVIYFGGYTPAHIEIV